MTAPCAAPLAPPGTLLTGCNFIRALLACISTAAHSIDCAVFLAARPGRHATREYAALWTALTLAPSRSLRCRALLQYHAPASPLHNAQLAAADALRSAGWSVRTTPRNRTLHAKFWIIDSAHVLLGSHNLTGRAAATNIEASIHLTAPQHANALRALYTALWADSSPTQLH
jgi:phosphatidylserine/phosphatidylglycerophosphate/cardiolipin synthase-like enzyme